MNTARPQSSTTLLAARANYAAVAAAIAGPSIEKNLLTVPEHPDPAIQRGFYDLRAAALAFFGPEALNGLKGKTPETHIQWLSALDAFASFFIARAAQDGGLKGLQKNTRHIFEYLAQAPTVDDYDRDIQFVTLATLDAIAPGTPGLSDTFNAIPATQVNQAQNNQMRYYTRLGRDQDILKILLENQDFRGIASKLLQMIEADTLLDDKEQFLALLGLDISGKRDTIALGDIFDAIARAQNEGRNTQALEQILKVHKQAIKHLESERKKN